MKSNPQMTQRGLRPPFDELTAYSNQRERANPQMAQMNADKEPHPQTQHTADEGAISGEGLMAGCDPALRAGRRGAVPVPSCPRMADPERQAFRAAPPEDEGMLEAGRLTLGGGVAD